MIFADQSRALDAAERFRKVTSCAVAHRIGDVPRKPQCRMFGKDTPLGPLERERGFGVGLAGWE